MFNAADIAQKLNMLDPVSFLQVLVLLPMFYILLVGLGVFLFFFGKKYMIEPKHSIRIAIEAFAELSRRHKVRKQKLKRAIADKKTDQNKTDDTTDVFINQEQNEEEFTLSEKQVQTTESLEHAKPGRRHGFNKFPIHDAPIWIISYIVILFGYTILATIDVWGDGGNNNAYWLEKLMLGHIPILRHAIPFLRPLPAVIAYLSLNYLILIVVGCLLSKILQIKNLHLLADTHPIRKTVKWLWRACGFIDYRRLDRSSHSWLLRPAIALGILLITIDLLVFFNRVSVWAGGLAVAHLFFIALVRVFDETWLYPVGFKHQRRKVIKKSPISNLAENLYRSGALKNVPIFIKEIEPETERFIDAPELTLPPVSKDLLVSLTGMDKFWDHQAIGWKNIFELKNNVILCGSSGSGKSTWARVVAVNEAIYCAGGTLIILPDRKSLKAEVQYFEKAVMNSGARWNLTIFDASSPEFLSIDIAKHPPLLVLADPDALETVLLRHWSKFINFWNYLSMIVIEDISRLSGIRTSNFYFLLRRLLVNRESENTRKIRICGTCMRSSKYIESELENLLGASMTFVNADAAPCVPILLYGVVSEEDESVLEGGDDSYEHNEILSLFQQVQITRALGAGIRKEGYRPYYDSRLIDRHEIHREHTLGSWEPLVKTNPSPIHTAASIIYVNHQNLINIRDDIKHFGAISGEKCHICFLVFSHSPVVQYFLNNSRIFLKSSKETLYRNFSFNQDNPFLLERHLEGSLENRPLTHKQLETIFGAGTLSVLLPELVESGRVEKIKDPTHPFAGCYILKKRRFIENVDPDAICSSALKLIHQSQGASSVVLQGEPVYIKSEYYPGKNFMWEGKRYTVRKTYSLNADPDTIEIKSCENNLITSKIRRMNVEIHKDDFPIESVVYNTPGGLTLRLEKINAIVQEHIVGYRTWDSHFKAVTTNLYDTQKTKNEHLITTRNTILTLTFEEAKADLAVFRYIVQLFRTLIPSLYFSDFDIPDIFVEKNKNSNNNAICFRELYPGGVGLINQLDEIQVLRYFFLSREILKTIPDIKLLMRPYCYGEDMIDGDEKLVKETLKFIDCIIPSKYSQEQIELDDSEEYYQRKISKGDAAPKFDGFPRRTAEKLKASIDMMETTKKEFIKCQ